VKQIDTRLDVKYLMVPVRVGLLMKFDASKIMLGHPGAPSVNIK
jgi:hypothetical protein